MVSSSSPRAGTAARAVYAGLFLAALPGLLAAWAMRLDRLLALPVVDAPAVGAALATAGLVLMGAAMWNLWARGGGLPASPFPPMRLVTAGAYAIFAHPIYVGAALTAFGASLLARSGAGFWIVSATLVLAMAAFVTGFERDATRRRFGMLATPWLRLPGVSTGPPTFRDRAVVYLMVFLPWGVLYQAIELLGVPPDAVIAYFDWEARLPIVPWTEAFYAATYLFVLAAPLAARRAVDLRAFARSGLWATALIILCYLLVPLIAPARPVTGDGVWQTLMRWERAFDQPVTAFPAFHVVWACLAAELWTRSYARARAVFTAFVAATAVSCITTGMHAVVDVAGGFIAYALVSRRHVAWRAVCAGAESIANTWKEVSLGPVRLLMHGCFAAVGAMLGVAVALSLAGPDVTGWILAMTAAAVVGAAVWGQLLEGSAVLLRPYGYFGSVIGVAIATLAAAGAGADIWVIFAAFGVGAAVTQAIGRLRCLVQGCCHGREAPADIGIRYTHPRSRVVRLAGMGGTPVHATPVYSLIWMLVVAAVMVRLWAVGAPLQLIAGLYFILAGVGRFVEEHYRGEPQTAIVGGLRLYQWLAILFVLCGAVLTTLGATPAPPPVGVSVRMTPALLGVALATFVAYGVDLPGSSRRFSRLA
ncbi:MAG TPA: prolipoprotein diacylglyceryl transferase family protein [Vicinamibacterales bacterium]|nr:prolipoprotein diacylglyceryl transferase family protein [Vicinamibacterales bacterium]